MKHITPLAIHTVIGMIALLLFILGILLIFLIYTKLGIISMLLSACLLQYASWFYKQNSKF